MTDELIGAAICAAALIFAAPALLAACGDIFHRERMRRRMARRADGHMADMRQLAQELAQLKRGQ